MTRSMMLVGLAAMIAAVTSCEKQEHPSMDAGNQNENQPLGPAKTKASSLSKPEPRAVPELGAPPASLKVGDKVTVEALQAATWIQGDAPERFEPGHVYIFECWATWCGPCIAMIPHMNKLHDDYKDQGLHIYGVHIFERTKKTSKKPEGEGQETSGAKEEQVEPPFEKVTKFVEGKGDEMQYPVAYAPKDSAFVSHWVKPARINGIPAMFLVIDGVLRLKTHPGRISSEVVEALLKGGEEADTKLQVMNAAQIVEESTRKQITEFRKATSQADVPKMEELLAEIENGIAPPQVLETLRVELMLAKEDWARVALVINGNQATTSFNYLCSRVGMPGALPVNVPAELLPKMAMGYEEQLKTRPKMQAYEILGLSGLQFKAGETEKALETAKEAEALAGQDPRRSRFPLSIYTQYREAIENGTFPAHSEFTGWIQEAFRKKNAK